MDRLTNVDAIRAFVDMIVEGGGKAFKPLTRQDLYELCKYCKSLESDNGSKPIPAASPAPDLEPQCPPQENPKEEYPSTADDLPLTPVSVIPESEPQPPDAEEKPKGLIPNDNDTRMTRAERYFAAGLDAQEAYDAFLKWSANHTKAGEAFVMDFEHGKRSESAAFAYWLLGKD